MASTRNINTPGDYELEQTSINRHFDTLTYRYAANGFGGKFVRVNIANCMKVWVIF
jgi:hypothetical protein